MDENTQKIMDIIKEAQSDCIASGQSLALDDFEEIFGE